MDSVIRWNRSDTTRLGRAVARFNRIAENSEVQNLPKLTYNNLKDEIMTRKELNRQIEKLNRLTQDTAETWTEDEMKREIALAEKKLQRKLKKVKKGNFMGNDEFHYLEGEIKNIKNLDKLSPTFKERKLERISKLASADYEMKEANTYRDWYIKSMEDYYSGFSGYDKLINKLNSIKNPLTLYHRIKDSMNESDIYFIRYSQHNQAFFDKILKAWGIDDDEQEEVFG